MNLKRTAAALAAAATITGAAAIAAPSAGASEPNPTPGCRTVISLSYGTLYFTDPVTNQTVRDVFAPGTALLIPGWAAMQLVHVSDPVFRLATRPEVITVNQEWCAPSEQS